MNFKYEPVIYYDEPDRKVVDLRPEGVSFIPLASRTICRYTRESPGLHVHRNLGEIVYCVSGALSFETPERIWPFLPGDVFVSGPDEPHTMRMNLKGAFVYRLLVSWPGKGRCLPGLSAAETAAVVKMLGNGSRRLFVGGQGIKAAFDRLFEIYGDTSGDNAFRGMRLRSCAIEILLACAEAAKRNSPRIVSRGVQKWIDLMANKPDAEYDIEEMAHDAKLTAQRFRTLFKYATGLPIHAYLMLCRIEGAKRAIRRKPDMSLLALSQQFRFSSAPHFATAFKRIAGKTVLGYAQSLARENA